MIGRDIVCGVYDSCVYQPLNLPLPAVEQDNKSVQDRAAKRILRQHRCHVVFSIIPRYQVPATFDPRQSQPSNGDYHHRVFHPDLYPNGLRLDVRVLETWRLGIEDRLRLPRVAVVPDAVGICRAWVPEASTPHFRVGGLGTHKARCPSYFFYTSLAKVSMAPIRNARAYYAATPTGMH